MTTNLDNGSLQGTTVPIRIFETGVLFGVALDAARSIKASPRAGGQHSALVSIVFSVVALEAFLNEVTELASDSKKYPPNLEPHSVSVFAEVMSDAERSHATLESKFTLANWILAGRRLDRGAQPYQDFALLIRLRNDLVHFKASDSFDQNATPEEIHKDLIARFKDKNILAENESSAGSWTFLVQTKAVAEWSCKTAALMVTDFCSTIPQSGFRLFLEQFQKSFGSALESA